MNDDIQQTILGQLYLTEQVDALNLDIVTLRDLVQEGELELMLGQTSKSKQQKAAFLEKVITKLVSPELRNSLLYIIHNQDLGFFSATQLPLFLEDLQTEVDKMAIINLSVAVAFKPTDIRDLSQQASEKLGKQAIFDLKVDRTLLGGAIIRYGNYISDYSLKSRLEQFRTNWRSAVLEKPHA